MFELRVSTPHKKNKETYKTKQNEIWKFDRLNRINF